MNGRPPEECQCPLTGLLHFYRYEYEVSGYKIGVSMPFNGLTPFLLEDGMTMDDLPKCVNAL